ncbi:MAG: helix-turn-helix transcriptional regulator [Eubacteriales bacterium]|nr:helix-turn-helix transcriptional regulator [Eubacteriales bacterium]
MKQNKEKYDFKAFGQAIKSARKAKGISRNQLTDKLNIAPRYIASIENSGQYPSLQILYELEISLDVSVDRFFFTEKETDKSTAPRFRIFKSVPHVADCGIFSFSGDSLAFSCFGCGNM